MILTDGIHLISDESVDELHEFAQSMGLKRSWFQGGEHQRHPHYDLTTPRAVSRAISKGAKKVTLTELVVASLTRQGLTLGGE